MLNALSIDVEEYFQTDAFARIFEEKDWENFESRVEKNVEKVLDILRASDTKATFFVLGWIAERHPALITEIRREGHEIASHGYYHRLSYRQKRAEFRQDVKRSKALLEDVTGTEVFGYRAPSFSIVRKNLWALDILKEEGFRYDGSIFPIKHDLYGIPDAERFPYRLRKPDGSELGLVEFPPSTLRILGRNVPFSGGTWLRVLPLFFLERAIAGVNRKGQPALVYLHPWELDPGHPRVNLGSLAVELRHYYNLGETERKFSRLVGRFNFAPIKQVLEERKLLFPNPDT